MEEAKKLDAINEKVAPAVLKPEETVTDNIAPAPAAEKAPASGGNACVVIQYAGRDFTYEELIQNAKNKFQYDMGGDPEAVKNIEIYVKPEDNRVYFLMDGVQGSYDM